MSSDQATKKISASELAAVLEKVDGKRPSAPAPSGTHPRVDANDRNEEDIGRSGVVRARGNTPQASTATSPQAVAPVSVAPAKHAPTARELWIGIALVAVGAVVALLIALR